MSTDSNVLKAYVGMLLDGTAFENWENKPNSDQRNQLVENIFLNFKGHLDATPNFKSRIKKVVMEAKNKEEIKSIIKSEFFKRDEFIQI